MWQNTKLLVSFSVAAIIFGLGLLWFGQTPSVAPLESNSAPIVESSSQRATNSAVIDIDYNSRSAQIIGIEGERALVTKVIDGDTIVVNGKSTVRFIGVDTPETVDPRRPVGCFGKEASNETKQLLSGQEIILQKDVSDTDKYGRSLRYIFLPLENGRILFVNDYLIREGFAKVLTYPPDVKYNEQFRQAEKGARESKRGLWGKCN